VVAQGYVPGLGHQDLVVDDCVGLEIDSREWHGEEQARADGDRDLRSEGLGRHVLRIRPHHVHETWPRTLAVIDRVVADALRLRR
jgi:very-short-patch-repair endonuclease